MSRLRADERARHGAIAADANVDDAAGVGFLGSEGGFGLGVAVRGAFEAAITVDAAGLHAGAAGGEEGAFKMVGVNGTSLQCAVQRIRGREGL